jgi:ATP-dependent RNA helicase DeaD
MLDMGFLEDIQKIFTYLPKKRQTLLFSATMPLPIQKLAQEILNEPAFVTVTSRETTNKDIKQHFYVIEEYERDDAIVRLVDSLDVAKSIIFCRTKREVDRLGTMLAARGYLARGLHGDMEQPQREEVVNGFRGGRIDILVATDVAARGLNVADVSHVFNYHVPFDPESYVHRIGRTARAGKKGVAITLVTPRELRSLQHISKTVGTQIELSFIPTLKEVKKVQMNKLLDVIKHQHLNEDATDLLKALEEEMDLSQIAYKLISLLLTQNNVAGPDRIGVDRSKMENLLRPPHDRNKKSGGGGRPYRGRPPSAGKRHPAGRR